ncbi:MAG: hypothetical protein KKD39_07165 [Candidatus Altiarchaeota archaeon]|nr:hypothetical protein [Candidatus Altiarchaeota archaeon]
MKYRVVFVFLVCVLLFTGCTRTRSQPAPPKPKVYVEPCNIANEGLTVSVNSNVLNAKALRGKIESVFVDDFFMPSSAYIWDSYTLDCYWGHNIDEVVNRYYCVGKYKAPESDETNTIKRLVWKEFKVGFSVQAHDNVHYLTVKSVQGSCYIAD